MGVSVPRLRVMMGDRVATLIRRQKIGSHFREVGWPRTLKSAGRISPCGSILLFDGTSQEATCLRPVGHSGPKAFNHARFLATLFPKIHYFLKHFDPSRKKNRNLALFRHFKNH